MKPPQIIVLGSINTDFVIRGPRLPAAGETVIGGRFYRASGGKGANQAVAAARAALSPVALIAAVGDDPIGRESLAALAAENLTTKLVKVVPGEPSGVALILVDESGENMISVASGANAGLTAADVDAIPDEVWRQARVFLACLESPLAAVIRGLERGRRSGLINVLNPAPAPVNCCLPAWLSLVDVLTPNAHEAAAMAGIDPRESAAASSAANALVDAGCRQVIVTLGREGCLIRVGQQLERIPGEVVSAVDATAAGDAFNGAMAVALAEGRPLLDAARWANKAAAISVTRAGAQPSLPSRAEIDEFVGRDAEPPSRAPVDPGTGGGGEWRKAE